MTPIYTYICTQCHIYFDAEKKYAKCPKCGEEYGHFYTKLIRDGSFALAYWLEDNPDVKIRKYHKLKLVENNEPNSTNT